MEKIIMILLSILVLLCYCIFFIWLTEGLRKTKYKTIPHTDELPLVSIIISARNEEKSIPALLESLLSLTYPKEKLEIIIVNDRSSDKTHQLLTLAEKEISYLHIIHINETPMDWAPKKWALQQAIDKSNYDIILQTDADCIFNPDWIQVMVSSFVNPTMGFISGPAPIRYNNSFFDQFALMDSLSIDAISSSAIKQGIPLSCTGRNISFRKTAFLDINGYDGIQDQISGDDDLLMQKMSLSKKWEMDFICNHRAIVNSPGPNTIEELVYQRLRFASKGINYYQLETNQPTRVILPFLYIINIFTVISISAFLSTLNGLWLIPFMIKLAGDALITLTFFNQLNIKWSPRAFFILEIIHPFYVVIFGAYAPFHKIKWKN
jgi:cellulose synthase/poly-beta-1,6-N-acetylglucosamine synthase-like glycosyltransferase